MSRSTITRTLTGVVAAAAFLVFAPASAEAQIYLGPQIAFHDDADLGIGAGLEFDLPSVQPGLGYMGDVIIFFPGDDFDYFEINTNVTYDLPLEDAAVVPFVLGGLNIARASFESPGEGGGDSDTELGFNLGGGVKFDAGSLKPRVSARAVLGGSESFTIWASLPFRIAN